MDESLQAILKYLRLGGLLAHWDELLAEARRGRFSHERLLKHVLEAEYRVKREHARLLRRQRANIPEMLEMETFPFARQPKLDRQKIMSLFDRFDYMTQRQNIVWLGPTGCGKSGLATAFLLQALDRGYRGYFITFPELIAELYAVAGRSLGAAGPPQVRAVRLPGDRRGGVCRDRAGPGRPVLHADAKASQDQDHADHLEPRLQRVGNAAEEQSTDRRLAQSADGNQPCDQHEELPQPASPSWTKAGKATRHELRRLAPAGRRGPRGAAGERVAPPRRRARPA